MSAQVYLNHIAVAVPEHDVHQKFIDFAPHMLKTERKRKLFRRMAERCQISHRYSCIHPEDGLVSPDWSGFYAANDFPDTGKRMQRYQEHAFTLARRALDQIFAKPDIAVKEITHLIVTSCTGFYAPGIDFDIIHHYGFHPAVERTTIGFMGCQAGMNALKSARHIVRSQPAAQVLIVNLELCTLHLQETDDLERVLSFLIFADGCAASLITNKPFGLALQSFHSTILPESHEHITWNIGDDGFDMRLSGRVPGIISANLPAVLPRILEDENIRSFSHWAIHPGGRTVLDAVRDGAGLEEEALRHSRHILRNFGNMSSASIMFVLKDIMQEEAGHGCCLAFGPGISIESMLFQKIA